MCSTDLAPYRSWEFRVSGDGAHLARVCVLGAISTELASRARGGRRWGTRAQGLGFGVLGWKYPAHVLHCSLFPPAARAMAAGVARPHEGQSSQELSVSLEHLDRQGRSKLERASVASICSNARAESKSFVVSIARGCRAKVPAN